MNGQSEAEKQQHDPARDRGAPFADRAREALEEIAKDARRAPTSYVEDTEVPGGGE